MDKMTEEERMIMRHFVETYGVEEVLYCVAVACACAAQAAEEDESEGADQEAAKLRDWERKIGALIPS
jgi:hypothetical protein